ncbi:hypothetical protein SDC9_192355 [bioreactor metagenome]|uniref:Uncharacterized protein n=1 Tax=bioreactor metagenome TaxID=1076179 RepID=A0A645I0L0_9ZZZZ
MRHCQPEVFCGVVFQRMGFVNNYRGVGREQCGGKVFFLPHFEVGKEQRVVGHDQIGLFPALAGLEVETAAEKLATRSQAVA